MAISLQVWTIFNAYCNYMVKREPRRSSGALAWVLLEAVDGRAGVLALFGRVAVDELDHRHGGVVAVAEARLQDADVAAVAVGVAGSQHGEQLADLLDVTDLADRLAARMQVAALGQRHQLLDEGPQLLGLRQGGDDLLVLDQAGRHVGEHGGAVGGRAAQFAVRDTVAHFGLSWVLRPAWNGPDRLGASRLTKPGLLPPGSTRNVGALRRWCGFTGPIRRSG